MAINFNANKTFEYTGGVQTDSLAPGIYLLEVWGAQGGSVDTTYSGGLGGYSKGYYKLTSTTSFNIYVGGAGGTSGVGGYNGGGWGRSYSKVGGGGGATDIRVSGTALSDRIIVAGGGGGTYTGTNAGKGGNGGGTSGGNGTASGVLGGTQTSGNALGQGGGGVSATDDSYNAGGGGGYYGGHASRNSSGNYGTGAGGSGYVASSLTSASTTGGQRSGNGQCKISNVASTPTIKLKSKSNTAVVVTIQYNCTLSSTKTVVIKNGSTSTTLNSVTSSETGSRDITYNLPSNTDGTITFTVNNGYFSTTLNLNIDNTPPVITFPTESYSTTWVKGETRVGFTGTDTNDTSLDYEVQLYLNDVMFHSYSTTSTSVTPPHAFVSSADEGEGTFYIKVRAKQSSDTSNGTTQDIWSGWYTSPSVQFKDNIITYPNFSLIKWYQDVEQQGLNCEYTQGLFETKHYCNGELVETTQHSLGLTPPLLYTPVKPHLWSYEYYAVTRVKVEGQWSGWYTSPTVEVQYNVQPNDIEFNKELPPYLIQGEVTTVEWKESTDPNATKTTYTASLMNNTTEELFEVRDIEEPRLTFTVPEGIVSNNVTFSIVAYSDSLYSNPVSSPKMAITDVKIMDCTLDFPVLNTNVTGQVTEFILEINGDRRISKAENFTNYTIPLHYFRKGENKLTLIAKDRNGVEVTRTWKVNLDFNNTNLIPLENIEVEGYMSFNHNEVEQYVPCTTLFKSNLDLGVVEHELYGSTTFEGANTVTQKLVIKRNVNDDLTQLRTLKITGAIE